MTPKVTRITQFNQVDSLGNPVPAVSVQFVVGTHGPFTLYMQTSDFTADNVNARIQKVADVINALPVGDTGPAALPGL